MSSSPSPAAEKKHWWISNRKIVDKYVRDARSLVTTQDLSGASAALGLLEAALSLSPRHEAALELKARCLLFLRRFREVADMLQDYIPSYKAAVDDDDDDSTSLGSSSSSDGFASQLLSRERAKLLPDGEERSEDSCSLMCFSVSDLKRKVLAGLSLNCDRVGHWRYLVLGKACCQLGLMEDAMVLLQTGRRLATAASRRESVGWSDDTFSNSTSNTATTPPPPPPSESETASNLLAHIKLLIRRRATALAAIDAGVPSEAVRHFSKIIDGRRGTPHAFAAGCLIGRAAAYRAGGRLAEAIADCNRALALDPSSIPPLRLRADLLEAVRAIPDCLRDLEHLKLLYDSILRDRKLPGPAWRPHREFRYRDIPASLRSLIPRIQELRLRVAAGQGSPAAVDYYALIAVRRGCSRSELNRAHLLISLRQKPEKATAFVDRLEFSGDNRDVDEVRDQARMSAVMLYRMIHKGYSSIMAAVMDEEAYAKQRVSNAAITAALKAATVTVSEKMKMERSLVVGSGGAAAAAVLCRDLVRVGFNPVIPVKYEFLSC